MGLLDRLFQRGESADEALLAVATARGWRACGRSGMDMLPPSHAAADVHGLGGRGAPHCAGRSFELSLGQQQRPAVVSHLEITVSDEQEHVYDMVTWQRPAGTLLRFEAELGEAAGQHHRLGDRFNPSGAAEHRLPGGVVLRIARDADPARSQAWCAETGWSELMQLAQGPALRGCVAEGLGERVVVYSWTGLPRKGQQRWLDLVAVAEGLDALIPFAHVRSLHR